MVNWVDTAGVKLANSSFATRQVQGGWQPLWGRRDYYAATVQLLGSCCIAVLQLLLPLI